jgi:sulfonate transport system permease protein
MQAACTENEAKMNKNRNHELITSFPLLGIIFPFLILGIWQLCGNLGVLNPSILPPPSKLLITFVDIVKDGSLQKNILISLKRVVSGYALGAFMGVVLGVAM